MIAITADHNEARLAGTLSFLDRGIGQARVRIYGGSRPTSPEEVPTSAMLVEVRLTKPAGVVADGQLSLTQEEDGLIAFSGQATWARFVNGDEETAFDCDAGEGTGPWEVQLASAQLYAGGDAKILSAVLT